jgi:hypothetical protein
LTVSTIYSHADNTYRGDDNQGVLKINNADTEVDKVFCEGGENAAQEGLEYDLLDQKKSKGIHDGGLNSGHQNQNLFSVGIGDRAWYHRLGKIVLVVLSWSRSNGMVYLGDRYALVDGVFENDHIGVNNLCWCVCQFRAR